MSSSGGNITGDLTDESDSLNSLSSESEPLLSGQNVTRNVAADEKTTEKQSGGNERIFGIKKSLIPFYGVYKLIRVAGLYPMFVLILLLMAYLINQLDRYTLPITAKEVAQSLHYGNRSCMVNKTSMNYFWHNYPHDAVDKDSIKAWAGKCDGDKFEYNSPLCLNYTANVTIFNSSYPDDNETIFVDDACVYNYDGTGILYQVVAGPVFNNIYIIAGIFLGFAADNFNRKVLLAICLSFWSVMTGLTGLTNEFWQLALLRFLLAIGAAGCTPFAASIIGDYFPSDIRGFALGIYNWGIYTGYSMAFALGNEVTQALNWRWVFYISGFIGLGVAPLILFGVREPKRTANADQKTEKDTTNMLTGPQKLYAVATMFIPKTLLCWCQYLCPASDLAKHALYFSPGLILLCVAGGIRNAGGYVWAYNTELFYEDEKGLTKDQITQFMAWIPLVGGSLGAFVGGVISDLIIEGRGPYHRIWVLIISQALGAPFALGGLLLPYPTCFYSLIFSNIIGEMWIGVALALVVDLTPSYIRTTVLAVYLFIITVIGGNFNLMVTACINAGLSRTVALVLCFPCLYAISSVLFVVTFFVMRYDLKMKKKMDAMPKTVNTSV